MSWVVLSEAAGEATGGGRPCSAPSAWPPIGAAHNDGTGSHTTLTAYDDEVGGAIASVSGDEGAFMGIEEPGIPCALWTWDYDQSAAGFASDNVTFSLEPAPVPALGPFGYGFPVALLVATLARRARVLRQRDRRYA